MTSLAGFDANDYDEKEEFKPLPSGDYKVVITESEMKANSRGTGNLLSLKLQVVDGPHAGRILFDSLNLDHPKLDVVEIARRTLASICRAVDVIKPSDSAELHDRVMLAGVVVKERTDQPGTLKNEIKRYKKASATNSSGLDKPRETAASSNDAPWNRKR